jgi:hypothetical protein
VNSPRLLVGLRVTVCYLVAFVLAELILGALIWSSVRESLFDLADDSLAAQAFDVQRFLNVYKGVSLSQLQAEFAKHYAIAHSEDCVEVSDSSGNVIYRSRVLGEHPLPTMPDGDSDRPIFQSRKLGNDRFRLLSERVNIEGRMFTVRIGRSMQSQSEMLNDMRKYFLWFAPILFAAASLLGYWLSKKTLLTAEADR